MRTGFQRTSSSGPTGSVTRWASHALSCSVPQSSIRPLGARLPSVTAQQRAPAVVDVGLAEGPSASEILRRHATGPRSGRPTRRPWRSWPASRLTSMISSGRGGSGGCCISLLRGARPARSPKPSYPVCETGVEYTRRHGSSTACRVLTNSLWGRSHVVRVGCFGVTRRLCLILLP